MNNTALSLEPQDADGRLALLLASGGDERISLDPITRRNRYGVPAHPASDEIWLSSSTAQAISPRGWAAARLALDRLLSGETSPQALQEEVRDQLARTYGPPDCEVILTGSGTEAELVVLGLALSRGKARPITNIVTAPLETGRGVLSAAAGRHFLGQTAYGYGVPEGEPLTGWEDAAIRVETLEIRDGHGLLRDPAAIDAEATVRVERAVDAGHQVILHGLDASKTGQRGVSLRCAGVLAARFGSRVMAVMDACQLRCSPLRLRGQLRNGLAAMITGSKFAGGPPFCGAVLLPKDLCQQVSGDALAALSPYSSAWDWPEALRPVGLSVQSANLSLVLRWVAALAEISAFKAIDDNHRTSFRVAFEQAVEVRLAPRPWLSRLREGEAGEYGNLIAVSDADHAALGPLWRGLADPRSGPACHLGQPVAVGGRDHLRLCSSMPMINDFAVRLAAVGDHEAAFTPVAADLDRVFAKWDALRDRHGS